MNAKKIEIDQGNVRFLTGAISTALAVELASPTTEMSGSVSRIIRIPTRSMLSLTISTLIERLYLFPLSTSSFVISIQPVVRTDSDISADLGKVLRPSRMSPQCLDRYSYYSTFSH